MKLLASQRGHAHLAVVLAVVALLIGGIGFEVYNAQSSNGGSSDLAAAASRARSSKSPNHGAIQFTVDEQLISSRTGKKVYKRRGNVLLQLSTKNTHARCRDGGKIFVPKAGGVVFAGKTDADKHHAANLGKIKVDSCSIGAYKLTPLLSDKYQIVRAPSNVKVYKKKITRVTIIIAKKAGTAAQAANTGGTPAPVDATANTAAAPFDSTATDVQPPDASSALDVQTVPANPDDPDQGVSIPDDLASYADQ